MHIICVNIPTTSRETWATIHTFYISIYQYMHHERLWILHNLYMSTCVMGDFGHYTIYIYIYIKISVVHKS